MRQQVEALQRRRPRPQLDDLDRAFWVAMRRAWRGQAGRLILVEPGTLVKWYRERFRCYWTELSRRKRGPWRPRVDRMIRELIRKMALENDWGAPRIHGELETLGLTISEATVSRYMPQRPANPDVVQQLREALIFDRVPIFSGSSKQMRLISVEHESPRKDPVWRRCHELRVHDAGQTWRVIYRTDPDAILVVGLFSKKTSKTPKDVMVSFVKTLSD